MKISSLKNFLAATFTSMLLVAPASALGAQSAPRGWESVRSDVSEMKLIRHESDFEIRATTGAIIVTASRPVSIKIFTILGRMVSTETIPVGTYRLPLPASGVYIVRFGDTTIKVAV